MSRKWIVALVGVLVIGGLALSQKDALLSRLLDRALETRLSGDAMSDLEDGLHVVLCGAGGPMPAPNASGPCVAVIAGDRFFVVDAGTDGVRNIGRMRLPMGRIEAVFLTHFHSDHIDGLGELATLRWVSEANTEPLLVHGPTGVEQVVSGFNQAYAQDQRYRNEHHGDAVAPLSGWGMQARAFDALQQSETVVLVDENDLIVEAMPVGHEPVAPAVAYRFRYKDRSVVISGDTIAMQSMVTFANEVDLLVHEALAPNLVMQMNRAAEKTGNQVMQRVTLDILDYHASPIEVAEIAQAADVGHLLYYHIVPPLVVPGQASLFLDGAEEVFAEYTIGVDGVWFSMPAGTSRIERVRDGL